MTLMEIKNRADILRNYLITIENEVSKNALSAVDFIKNNEVCFRAEIGNRKFIFKAYHIKVNDGIICGRTESDPKLYHFYMNEVEFL